MKTLLFSLFLSAISGLLLAQNGNAPLAGARGAGMAGAGLLFEDVYSSFSNQAGLAFLEGFSAGVTAEQRFLVQELQLVGAAAAYPTGSGTFGLALSYFGFEAYNEQKVGLNYARLLTDKLSLGAQVNYLTTRIPTYGSAGTFSFELGLQAKIGETVRLGVHSRNPVRAQVVEGEPLATLLGIGLGYVPSESLLVVAEVQTELGFGPRFKMGIDYELIDILYLRVGAATNPTIASFGIGLELGPRFKMDFATQYHLILGWSPAIGISYQ